LTGPTGTVLKVVIDRHAPLAPTITDPSGSVGPSAIVAGNAEINSIVAVSVNGNVLCTALTDGTGAWSCNAAFSTAGANTLTATATDVAGNTSPVSAPFDVTVDISDLVFRNGFDG
jgi:outer membrane protein assembly factor BamB